MAIVSKFLKLQCSLTLIPIQNLNLYLNTKMILLKLFKNHQKKKSFLKHKRI